MPPFVEGRRGKERGANTRLGLANFFALQDAYFLEAQMKTMWGDH